MCSGNFGAAELEYMVRFNVSSVELVKCGPLISTKVKVKFSACLQNIRKVYQQVNDVFMLGGGLTVIETVHIIHSGREKEIES